MSYVRLAIHPWSEEAFQRAVSVPKRGIGAVTIERIVAGAKLAEEPSLIGFIERLQRGCKVCHGKLVDVGERNPPAVVHRLSGFMRTIQTLQKGIQEKVPAGTALKSLIQALSFKRYIMVRDSTCPSGVADCHACDLVGQGVPWRRHRGRGEKRCN